MKRKSVVLILLPFLFILSCKSKPIMPESIKILKGFNYSELMDSIKLGKFENDKKIDNKEFSEIVKNEFKRDGFIFKTEMTDFILNGKLLRFKESENTDYLYTDVNGVSIPIEDTNTSYEISFILFIVNKATNKQIWSCKVSEKRETDYPESLIAKMVKACLKTMKTENNDYTEKGNTNRD